MQYGVTCMARSLNSSPMEWSFGDKLHNYYTKNVLLGEGWGESFVQARYTVTPSLKPHMQSILILQTLPHRADTYRHLASAFCHAKPARSTLGDIRGEFRATTNGDGGGMGKLARSIDTFRQGCRDCDSLGEEARPGLPG